MHTIKITPNLLFEYQCTSGEFITLPNRIESNRNIFRPNWNALDDRLPRVIVNLFLPGQSQRSSFAVIGYAEAGRQRTPMTCRLL